MSLRNRTRPTLSFTDRLTRAAAEARAKADKLKPGKDKDQLLEKAREFEAQLQLNKFLQTPGAPPD